ncbi:MAG: hypothetical protein ABIQ93_08370, partial [Saprospiraceae bacterium]
WNNTIAGIRAYILAHPETPDFCGGARLESDAAPEQIIGSRAFLKKHNYTFPKSVKLQKGRK